MEYGLEVVVLPVSDVDKAKDFYQGLGWRLDADFHGSPDYRVVQLTPPGSACSVIFGIGVSSATPGSVQGLHLVTADIDAARADLATRGAEVSDVFHDATGVFHHAGRTARVAGPLSGHKSYGSFVSFDDPDGNGWLVQEITTRLPGR
jgi:catechol 2,3-dioxygenase-like lactoylglutathione lyase family enzyme